MISLAGVLTSRAKENKEVQSANNLHSLLRPSGESLRYIKNKRGPRMEPCGTPAHISSQGKYWPFKTTLFFLLVKKSFSILNKSPHIQFWRCLYISTAYQTLSKAFEISRNSFMAYIKSTENCMIDGEGLINTTVSRSETWLFWGY